ncbi:LOW QUALITY PROTEIN: adhesion G-protein coupled receptor G4-like [Dama dama]
MLKKRKEITKVSSSITPTSSPAEPTFPSGKTIPTTIMAGTVTPFIGILVSPLLISKTEAISSIPKTTFSSFLSTAQQSSQKYQATTLGIFPGITNSSLSTVSSGKVIALTNTYSRTAAPESVLSSTLENLHASLNIQISPSLTGFKSTPGSTKSVKTTIYHSSNTEKKTSSSENTSTAELTSAMSVNTPVSYPPWIPSGSTSPSLTSVLVSPQSTEAKFSTPKTSLPPMSQTVEFPVLQTRTTSSNTQSLLLTSWNTPTAEDSQFSASTTAYVPTSNKKQTESPYVSTESLSTFPVSQTGLVPGDIMAMSSISTTGTLPTLGMSESPSLSISSKSIPVTLADIKHTFEKTTTSVTPGTTLPSNISDAASESIISKASTSPMLTWILSSLPSGSPLATRSNTHIIFSSPEEVLKSTFLTSDITPTHPLTNFTIGPFAGVSAVLIETTPTPTVGDITVGFPSPFPVSIKITDDSTYISKSSGAFSRITVTANSRTVPQAPSFSRISKSPPVDHTPSVGAMFLPSPTTTSAWSRIPAAPAPTTLVLPKPTQESLLNIAATTSTATGAPFPLISTGVTHPFTANVSSLPSSSFETGWPDSTPSFLSTETSTYLLPLIPKVCSAMDVA